MGGGSRRQANTPPPRPFTFSRCWHSSYHALQREIRLNCAGQYMTLTGLGGAHLQGVLLFLQIFIVSKFVFRVINSARITQWILQIKILILLRNCLALPTYIPERYLLVEVLHNIMYLVAVCIIQYPTSCFLFRIIDWLEKVLVRNRLFNLLDEWFWEMIALMKIVYCISFHMVCYYTAI